MKKISNYWKCQIIGWGLYEIANLFFSLAGSNSVTLFRFLLVFALNILLAHLMRKVILQFGVLKKRFFVQIVFLLGITTLFSAIAFVLEIGLIILFEFKNNLRLIKKTDLPGFYMLLFFVFVSRLIWNLIYFGYHYVKKNIQEERQKAVHEKRLWELEALALRAQMNPHFIFNCMNSIKSLIQQKEKDKSIEYLNAFSKLLRTIFQNSDKKEISLLDEIETCKLYTQLESMRFGKKLSYAFNVDESLDLKSIRVPAFIIQPFIENSIWHGIMPKEDGRESKYNCGQNRSYHLLCIR